MTTSEIIVHEPSSTDAPLSSIALAVTAPLLDVHDYERDEYGRCTTPLPTVGHHAIMGRMLGPEGEDYGSFVFNLKADRRSLAALLRRGLVLRLAVVHE